MARAAEPRMTPRRHIGLRPAVVLAIITCGAVFARVGSAQGAGGERRAAEQLRPGITVLLEEQLSSIRGRRVALIVDGGARDTRGVRVVELLSRDKRVRAARVVVTAVWSADSWPSVSTSPLGSGTAADSAQLARLSLMVDSVAQGAQALVVDLLDGGVRTSAAPWIMKAVLRCAARHSIPVVVLDRPNPLTGEHAEGPVADSIAGASDALYGLPARHGMTIGEIARWFNLAGGVGASLQVVPVRGWRRSRWPPDRGVTATRPDGQSLAAAQLAMLGALAPLAATNIALAAGPGRNSVRLGAPWLDANVVADRMSDRLMSGLTFRADRDSFVGPTGMVSSLPCVVVEVTDRDSASGLRTLVALVHVIRNVGADSLRIAAAFDRLVGSPVVRQLLLAGEDPDAIADRQLAAVVDFRRRVRSVLLYR